LIQAAKILIATAIPGALSLARAMPDAPPAPRVSHLAHVEATSTLGSMNERDRSMTTPLIALLAWLGGSIILDAATHPPQPQQPSVTRRDQGEVTLPEAYKKRLRDRPKGRREKSCTQGRAAKRMKCLRDKRMQTFSNRTLYSRRDIGADCSSVHPLLLQT
jgi:hypothetical protein